MVLQVIPPLTASLTSRTGWSSHLHYCIRFDNISIIGLKEALGPNRLDSQFWDHITALASPQPLKFLQVICKELIEGAVEHNVILPTTVGCRL